MGKENDDQPIPVKQFIQSGVAMTGLTPEQIAAGSSIVLNAINSVLAGGTITINELQQVNQAFQNVFGSTAFSQNLPVDVIPNRT